MEKLFTSKRFQNCLKCLFCLDLTTKKQPVKKKPHFYIQKTLLKLGACLLINKEQNQANDRETHL